MKEIQLKDGRTIVLKPMDKSLIIAGGGGRCPANCDMRIGSNMKPTDNFRRLSEKLIERYGATMILALDQDLIVGFVCFSPMWVPHYNMCDDKQIEEGVYHIKEIENPPVHSDPVLHVNCLVVKEKYRGNHLSVHLLEYLEEWARSHGWRKIVAHGCIFTGKAAFQWLVSPKPPKPVWEKAGFLPGEDFRISKTGSSYDMAREHRQWYRTFEFPDYVPRDVDPDDPDWYEIFKDYTMICQL